MSAAYKYGVVANDGKFVYFLPYCFLNVQVTFLCFLGTLKLNPNCYSTNKNLATIDAEDIDDFERTESLGGFEYNG